MFKFLFLWGWFIVLDLGAYYAAPKEIRTAHWGYMVPGGGFLAFFHPSTQCNPGGAK